MTTTPSPSFLVDAFPISRHKSAIRGTYERLSIVSSVGFAIAASNAISLAIAVATPNGHTNDRTRALGVSAEAFGAASVVHGLGFITSVMAVIVPISDLERSLHPKLRYIWPCCFTLYLMPFWSVAWATTLLFNGMFKLYPRTAVKFSVLFGTIVCPTILLVIIWFLYFPKGNQGLLAGLIFIAWWSQFYVSFFQAFGTDILPDWAWAIWTLTLLAIVSGVCSHLQVKALHIQRDSPSPVEYDQRQNLLPLNELSSTSCLVTGAAEPARPGATAV